MFDRQANFRKSYHFEMLTLQPAKLIFLISSYYEVAR